MKGRNDYFLTYILRYKPSLIDDVHENVAIIAVCSCLAAHNLRCIQKQIALAGIELPLKNVFQLHFDGYCNYSIKKKLNFIFSTGI